VPCAYTENKTHNITLLFTIDFLQIFVGTHDLFVFLEINLQKENRHRINQVVLVFNKNFGLFFIVISDKKNECNINKQHKTKLDLVHTLPNVDIQYVLRI
jgi:hypothetical protein